MSLTAAIAPPARHGAVLTPGAAVALGILTAAVASVLLARVVPWIAVWPEAWTLPVARWIGEGVGGFLAWIKPAARLLSAMLSYPMAWAHVALVGAPWPAVCGAILGLAWWAGGGRLALLAAGTLGFTLASGYWDESMNTLSLVTVSVPLALALGLAIGVIAYEVRCLRKTVETVLDVMQTVPTFAYLTPLLVLFGFGPVVGLIASAIYAAPPMARNVLLGLERVDPEIREAAAMAGTTRPQRLVLVELPAASQQIMVGVNQCVMAALTMVIIAAVIGGFDDIGWEVLLTMRKAQFGQSLLAGLVIVVFAVLIDRLSAALAETDKRGDWRVAVGMAGIAVFLGLIFSKLAPDAAGLGVLRPVAEAVDVALGTFTATHGATLDTVKNTAMFYVLLPLRIGFDDAVLPFTWGFAWTGTMTFGLLGTGAIVAALLAWQGKAGLGSVLLYIIGVLLVGIVDLPWIIVIGGVMALGSWVGGWRLAAFCGTALAAILLAGLWERAMLSLYLCGAAVFACATIGAGLGLLAAVSPLTWRILRPICDTLQTIPLFVFLIPVLMFFQIGDFSAFLAICAYAIVPMIRYTRHGLVTTPDELVEAARASGATSLQILRFVRAPYAAPTVLLGLNQTILYAFAMLVIAALIGTTGLGQAIYLALGEADVGLGVAAGAAMALLALVADRLVQALAAERRRALGL